jgi:outer membrane receptor protein involved in Fe transport
VAFGVEHRKATASEIPNEVWRYGLAGGVLAEFTATLEQSEAFGEAIVPLLKDLPFAHYVGLELGVRYTDFKPGDSAVTYKALGEWAPTEKLRIRGGLQRATRAPNPFELGGGDQEFSTIGNLGGDPCFMGAALTGDLRTACIANGVPVAVADGGAIAPDDHEFLQTYFGNPLLEPELAKTWTAGVVLQDLPCMAWYEFDINWMEISVMQKLGLATDVYAFSEKKTVKEKTELTSLEPIHETV